MSTKVKSSTLSGGVGARTASETHTRVAARLSGRWQRRLAHNSTPNIYRIKLQMQQ